MLIRIFGLYPADGSVKGSAIHLKRQHTHRLFHTRYQRHRIGHFCPRINLEPIQRFGGITPRQYQARLLVSCQLYDNQHLHGAFHL